jgi:hypothetical protein
VIPSKESIKAWLKSTGKDREWLAEQLGKKLGTVNNWLSTNIEIPDGPLAIIRRLMEDDAAAEAVRQNLHNPANHLFSIEVDRETFTLFNRASAQTQQTIEEWAISELTAAALEAQGAQTAAPPNITHISASSPVNSGSPPAPANGTEG